ncbi:hypothetical protein ACHAPT_011075 [Fusarium lateritium]
MDIYTTASTAIHDIYSITVFIRTVIADVNDREQTLLDIQVELEHEFLFLETFKTLFFGDEDNNGDERPGRWFESLPENFQRDVKNILCRLRRCLDSYEIVALKHGLNLSEANILLEREDKQIEPRDSQIPPERARKGNMARLRAKLEDVRKKIDWEEKLKGLEWALFDKDETKKLVEQYGEWTGKLRQVMMLILLVSGKLGNYDRVNLGAEISTALGVTKAIRRQIRAKSKHPANFPPLTGRFKADPVDDKASASSYTAGTFTEAFAGPTSVIMERHDFVINDNKRSEAQRREMKMELVRSLAWLLNGDISSTESISPDYGTTPMYLLRCLGYYTMGGTEQSLVYKVPPQAGKPKTLHDWINHNQIKEHEVIEREMSLKEREGAPRQSSEEKKAIRQEKYKVLNERSKLEQERNKSKPGLSNHFFLAWALASTLYNIHASGWVHKDVWSRAILVFQPSDTFPLDQRIIPYLLGWSVSRPQTDEFREVSKPYHSEIKAVDKERNNLK